MLSGIIILMPFLFCGCGKPAEPLARTGFYFDTVITITLYDKQDDALLDECFALAEFYENMLSKTRENSDVWNINHGKGKPVAVSSETLKVLRCALSYAALSEGKADPTIGLVTELWDFSSDSDASVPAPNDLHEALSHVGYEKVTIKEDTVSFSDPLTEIDLGFIAKGYIADRMKDYLVSQGVSSATINLGGNVLTIGSRPDGTPFRIGIQNPLLHPVPPPLLCPSPTFPSFPLVSMNAILSWTEPFITIFWTQKQVIPYRITCLKSLSSPRPLWTGTPYPLPVSFSA